MCVEFVVSELKNWAGVFQLMSVFRSDVTRHHRKKVIRI
jgi:hypothetical protein